MEVEKRLKLENPSQKSTISPSPLPESSKLLTEDSLSSPLYLHLDQPSNNHSSNTLQDSSEPPQAFLSCSLFPTNPRKPTSTQCPASLQDHQ
ncbi:hypothetical protein Prudu_011227 [Prunus dulcis]|uniref:Uncharacterized protein n=1 Tax=Prunus dulcis TaxID=3755 RepID=A0A4Y1RA40_PRUDU|nr:hypothetical protein Prudu_011227 [Prunus dulcis]